MSNYNLCDYVYIANLIREVKDRQKILCADVDGTLCQTREPLSDSMAVKLVRYLNAGYRFCIISAQTFENFTRQVVKPISIINDSALRNLHAFLEQGSQYFRYENDDWRMVYEYPISDIDKKIIARTIQRAMEYYGYQCANPVGNVIQYRTCLVTYSALGDQAKREDKSIWDPAREKRSKVVERCQKEMPEFKFGVGGSTSIDATIKGRDKAFAIPQVAQYLDIERSDICYVCDEASETGNDYPIVALGVPTISVGNPEETEKLFEELLR